MEMEHPQQLQYIVCRRCGAATTDNCAMRSLGPVRVLKLRTGLWSEISQKKRTGK